MRSSAFYFKLVILSLLLFFTFGLSACGDDDPVVQDEFCFAQC